MTLSRTPHLDGVDLRLLNLLQHDASLSNQALADAAHLSAATCHRRVKRLWDEGFIERQVATDVDVASTELDRTAERFGAFLGRRQDGTRRVARGEGLTSGWTCCSALCWGMSSTYDVLVRRVDNTLSALSVTPPSTFPAPGFNPSILTYQIDVASGVSNVAVVATKADVHAVMSGSVMAAAGIATGQATIPLKEQGKATVVSITVAGPNGEAKTYTITINRLSGNNTLRELSVIPGTFDRRFDPTVTGYVVTAPTKAEQVTVTATKSDPLSAMSGNVTAGAGIETGTGTFQLGAPGSELPLSITVAAADPTVPPREYRITVKRAVPSNNANLSALTADAGSFDPPIFNPDTKNYEVKVGLLFPGNVTLTATKSDPNATMSALGSVIALPGTPTGHVTVTPGFGIGTPVNIDVRAEDGVNSTTYTITVVRGLF